MTESFLNGKVELRCGDAAAVVRDLPAEMFDAVVCDPPYALVSIQKRLGKPGSAPSRDGDVYARASAGFMGKQWDTGETAFDPMFWAEVLRVAKPGAHLVAFGGTRSYHRLVCAIEDAGWEIRDQLAWLFGSGFPKSHDVSKGIDKMAGAEREVIRERYTVKRIKPGATVVAEGAWGKQDVPYTATDTAPATDAARQWQGWGTALKPAHEPVCLARKPLIGTIAANVLAHGTGAINVDGCRIATDENRARMNNARTGGTSYNVQRENKFIDPGGDGRWPANVVHDGSDEVLAGFPETGAGSFPTSRGSGGIGTSGHDGQDGLVASKTDSGSAARFFYCAKADASDRLGAKHPTVKPVDLMQWLVRLVTPNGGLILDPFAGTGTTGEAAWREGMRAVLIEREAEYQDDIRRRMKLADAPSWERKEATRRKPDPLPDLPLFGDDAA